MKRFNSSITQKKCKCSADCEKYPTLGYKGYFIHHFPGEIKKQYRNHKAQLSKISRELHKVSKENTKSDYLKIADIAFGNWIKKRDSDSNGNVDCICCGRTYNLKDKNESNEKVIQALHFVPRGVYSLRFSEINVHAGCSFCNLLMHVFPDGHQYKVYKEYLINSVGEDVVREMESEKRNINKITENDLKAIIKKYKKQ
jgi:peptide methionine sulfoxide reductase MsrB